MKKRMCGMSLRSKKGMELVQVGILIAIAVGIGLIFKEQIGLFVNNTFSTLLGSSFNRCMIQDVFSAKRKEAI